MTEITQIVAFISMGSLCITLYFLYQRCRLKKSTRSMKKTKISLRNYLKKQKSISNGLSTEIEENISLDNNYKILHRKLKIEFWVFFGITILCWSIMIILGISSGFFSSINDQSGAQKKLSTFLCSKIF